MATLSHDVLTTHDGSLRLTPTFLAPQWQTLSVLAGLLFPLYVVKLSVLPILMEFPESFVALLSYIVFCASLLAVIPSRFQIRSEVVVLLGLTAVSIPTSIEPRQSLIRWFGFAVMILVLSPAFQTAKARAFRAAAWPWILWGTIAASFLSILWYLFDMPNLGEARFWGRGRFSGITSHSMTLGFYAAFAVLGSTLQAIRMRSPTWAVTAGVCIFPCFLASSRGAVICLWAALTAMCMEIFPRFRWVVVPLLVIVPVGAYFLIRSDPYLVPGASLVSGLIEKQTMAEGIGRHSRENKWRDRLDEFASSPIHGVGFGADTTPNYETDFGTKAVEPGSSYLAILSMTGIIGAAGVGWFCWVNGRQVVRGWNNIPRNQRAELVAFGTFYAVNAVAEGWIYAIGCPSACMFWLWTGRFVDLATTPRRRAKAAVRPTA